MGALLGVVVTNPEKIEQQKLPEVFHEPSRQSTMEWETYIARLRTTRYLGLNDLLPALGSFGGYVWVRFTQGAGIHMALEALLSSLGILSLLAMLLMWCRVRRPV